MKQVGLKAYAKINLGLDVIRKRQDGYHEVRMIMQSISLHDKLTMRRVSRDEIVLRTNLGYLPTNERNLVYKAIWLIKKEFGVAGGVRAELNKNIPVAAGMAGGSTDAAAALVGMNHLFQLKLGKQKLMELGAQLGADVPYCVMRGTVLSEGIGEMLTPLKPIPECYILIAKPGINVSTRFVYENLEVEKLPSHPDIDGMVEAIGQGDLKGIAERMANALETVTEKKYPIISRLKHAMVENGALNALMSGSGPTVFGIFEHKGRAEQALIKVRKIEMVKDACVVEPFRPK